MENRLKKIFFILLVLSFALACTMSNQVREAVSTPSPETTIITANRLPESATDATRSPTAAADVCKVNTGFEGGTVNVRTCAGTACSVLAVVTEGESLDILTADEWMNVTTASGITGWINSKYCMGW